MLIKITDQKLMKDLLPPYQEEYSKYLEQINNEIIKNIENENQHVIVELLKKSRKEDAINYSLYLRYKHFMYTVESPEKKKEILDFENTNPIIIYLLQNNRIMEAENYLNYLQEEKINLRDSSKSSVKKDQFSVDREIKNDDENSSSITK